MSKRDDNEERGHTCITRIFLYNLEPQIFYVSLTGRDQEIQQFHLKLLVTNFVGVHVSPDVFVATCYTILKQLLLADLRVIAFCFDGHPSSLHLISARGIERQTGQNSYIIALPASFSPAAYYRVNRRFTCSELFQTKAEALAFIQNVLGQLPPPGNRLPGTGDSYHVSISNPADLKITWNQ